MADFRKPQPPKEKPNPTPGNGSRFTPASFAPATPQAAAPAPPGFRYEETDPCAPIAGMSDWFNAARRRNVARRVDALTVELFPASLAFLGPAPTIDTPRSRCTVCGLTDWGNDHGRPSAVTDAGCIDPRAGRILVAAWLKARPYLEHCPHGRTVADVGVVRGKFLRGLEHWEPLYAEYVFLSAVWRLAMLNLVVPTVLAGAGRSGKPRRPRACLIPTGNGRAWAATIYDRAGIGEAGAP